MKTITKQNKHTGKVINIMITQSPDRYHRILPLLQDVPINVLFVKAVLEHHVSGKVFVDDPENPNTAIIVHPYGMALLIGFTTIQSEHDWIKNFFLYPEQVPDRPQYLQAWPPVWDDVLPQIFSASLSTTIDKLANPKVIYDKRVNFRFNSGKYRIFRQDIGLNPGQISRVDAKMFDQIEGTVVPKKFWDNSTDFINKGTGFSVIVDNKPASTAFSAFRIDDQLEIGIETAAEFRGKGTALVSSTALIDYCIYNNLNPVWACRYGNTASLLLAQKLGFEIAFIIPFYYFTA